MDVNTVIEDTSEQLKQLKAWLFQENIRLETAKKELEEAQEKFNAERTTYRREMDALNRRTVQERQRLREEELFFDKKMAILQDGFRQLEEDRRAFERQKAAYQNEQKNKSAHDSYAYSEGATDVERLVRRLFANINNPLALRKRYRDLIKIYHPDNFFGDEELVQMINKEYIRRKEE